MVSLNGSSKICLKMDKSKKVENSIQISCRQIKTRRRRSSIKEDIISGK
jgi:hypothetical protein